MKVLVLNCGSSSLKFQLFDMDQEDVVAKGVRFSKKAEPASCGVCKVRRIMDPCNDDVPHIYGRTPPLYI